MTVFKSAIKGGLAALVVAVMTVGAYAWPAAATNSLNVRSGPGTHFNVVAVLHRNERVEVDYCRGSWCFIQTRYTQGWASSNYLARLGQPQPPQYHRPSPPPHWQRPPHRPPHWERPRPPQYPGWYDNDDGWYDNDRNDYRNDYDSRVCFNGPNGYFCFGN